MCAALQQYGTIVAQEILSTGCRVNIWDIGNETNFGFGGVAVGMKSAVNPKLEKAKPMWIYPRPHMGAAWLAENVWKYNAKMMAAVAVGVRAVEPQAKFSAHVATAIADTSYVVRYFLTLLENGFSLDEAGISFYPSVPGPQRNQLKKLKTIVSAIHRSCGLNVFIAEYAYPSKPMSEGQFKGWNWKTKGYDFTEEDQSRLLQEIIAWGKINGLSGIRTFAPDLNDGWEPMSLFHYDRQQKVSTAKKALLDLRK
jgi:arabinogalactan endo-1,4-beta-galactosidase